MPSKGGLISILIGLVYVSHFGILKDRENCKIGGEGTSFLRITKVTAIYVSVTFLVFQQAYNNCPSACMYALGNSPLASNALLQTVSDIN